MLGVGGGNDYDAVRKVCKSKYKHLLVLISDFFLCAMLLYLACKEGK